MSVIEYMFFRPWKIESRTCFKLHSLPHLISSSSVPSFLGREMRLGITYKGRVECFYIQKMV